MIYEVKAGQNLLDIAVQMYGTVEMVVQIAWDNGLNLDTDLTPGQKIVIDEYKVVKPKTVKYFHDNNITIATNGTQ